MMKNNNEENFEVEDSEKHLHNGAFALIIIGGIVFIIGYLMMLVNLDFRISRHYVLGNKRFIKRRIERYKRHKKIVRSDNYMIVMIILYVVGLTLLIAGFLILKKLRK